MPLNRVTSTMDHVEMSLRTLSTYLMAVSAGVGNAVARVSYGSVIRSSFSVYVSVWKNECG